MGCKIFVNVKMVYLICYFKDLVIFGYYYYKKGLEIWNKMLLFKLKFYKFFLELDYVLNDEEKKLFYLEVIY